MPYNLIDEYNKVFTLRSEAKEARRAAAQKAAEWTARVIQEGRCQHRSMIAREEKNKVRALIALTGGLNTSFLTVGMHIDEMAIEFYGPESHLCGEFFWNHYWILEGWDEEHVHLSRGLGRGESAGEYRTEPMSKFLLYHSVNDHDDYYNDEDDEDDWDYESVTELKYYPSL